jgi:hypothetical protein
VATIWAWLGRYGILICLWVLVMLPIHPNIVAYTERDPGVFLYSGWRILEGELPYRDFWDHKPPIIFYLNALGLALARGSATGVWLLEAVSLAIAMFFSHHLLALVFSPKQVLFGMVCWLSGLMLTIQIGNLTSEFTLPLQFAILYLFVCYNNQRVQPPWLWLVMGVLVGLIFMTKQNVIGVGLAVTVYGLLQAVRSHNWGIVIQRLLALSIGFGLIVAIIVGYFVWHGAFDEFWDVAFRYNFAYVGNESWVFRMLSTLEKLFAHLLPFAWILIIGWCIAFWQAIKRTFDSDITQSIIILALISLPIELFLVSSSGRGHEHYFMAVLPLVAVFSAYLYAIFSRYNQKTFRRLPTRRMLSGLMTGVILVFFGYVLVYQFAKIWRYNGAYRIELVQFIQSETQISDAVLMWGAETSYNFVSQRVAPTRFNYQYPLFLQGYATPSMTDTFLQDILVNKPRLIVDTYGQGLNVRVFVATSAQTAELLRQIQALYDKVDTVAGWDVYRLIDN